MTKDRHVSELLGEVFRRGGMKKALRRAEAVLLWPQVAGPQLARFTRARKLVDGVLFVDVSDSETAMHLTLQRQRFVDVLRGKFGAREVRDVRFQPGRVPGEDSPEPEQRVAAEADPQDLSKLARTLGELELPESLSGQALQAGRSMLAYRARRLAEGWSSCTACEALTPEAGLCSSCKRYAAQPRVRTGAAGLAVDPGLALENLSDDERSVAALLAQRQLENTLSELLPQVLADQELRPQLEAAARSLLALKLRKSLAEVQERDMASLPARVARVLGYWA